MRPRYQILYWSVCLLLCYLVTEVLFSALYVRGLVTPPDSVMLFEDSGKTVHFDPVLGFRYTPLPSRAARLTHGEVEFLTTFKGNNLGFNERDPVLPDHPGPGIHRVAVLGDSFTAAEHLTFNWPDRLERLPAVAGRLRLPNFSVSGAGLANWWSIVERLLAAGDYRFDGVVFAVFEGDLHRTFSMADHRQTTRHMFGRSAGWDPADWPTSLAEARAQLQPLRGYIVGNERFEQALRDDWHPELPRPWRAYGWRLLHQRLLGWGQRVSTALPSAHARPLFTAGQWRLIHGLRDYLQDRGLAVMVVRIPSREGLLAGVNPAADTKAFAAALDAQYLDGATTFADLDETQIRQHWLPHDGHWNQAGSDRFAAFLAPRLLSWLESSGND